MYKKTNIKQSFFFSFLFLVATSLFAQTASNELSCIFKSKKNKIFTQNELKQNVVVFSIIGLNTQTEIDNLRQKFIKKDGVQKFLVASNLVDGNRRATLILNQNLLFSYLKQLLIEFEINKVVIDGKIVNTIDICTEKTKKIKDC